eukprot:799794-Pleurochrysis_carterae.AAC.1
MLYRRIQSCLIWLTTLCAAKNDANNMTLVRQTRYQRVVGGMLYIAMTTRPDISYAIGMFTRCLAFPTDELLKEAERVVIYLYNTRTLAITYKSRM